MSSNNDSFTKKILSNAKENLMSKISNKLEYSIISTKSAISRSIDESISEALELLIQKIEQFESQTKAKLKELEQKNKALINQNTQLKENNRHLKAQNQKLETKIKGLSKWEMISK